jgi:acetyl esterase/lipase
MIKTTRAASLALCAAVGLGLSIIAVGAPAHAADSAAAPAPASAADSAAPSAHTIRVILVGDSTIQRNSGYGEHLCARFKPDVECINVAKGGRSSRTFREEGLWQKVLDRLADKQSFETSYVLIQFGHNDQPGKPERSTTLPEFTENMARYVKETREAGAVPVLITPLTRRQFKNGKITQDLEPWAAATRQVAKDNNVPLLDLTRDSEQAVQNIGSTRANDLAQAPPSAAVKQAALTGTTIEANPSPANGPKLPAPPVSFDYTHLGPKGGEFFAEIVAKELRGAVKPLARHLSSKGRALVTNAPQEFQIWRSTPPGAEKVTVKPETIERSKMPGRHDRALVGITTPTLTVYRPEKPDGSAVLVIPGGAYLRVVIDKEGEETARRLNAHGITAAVLIYRLPGDGWAAGRDASLQDAQRAMRLMRSGMAGAVDPKRIGVLGFSAGGDLAAAVTLRHDDKLYEPVDQADLASARPDFTVLMYAALEMPVRLANGGELLPPTIRYAPLINSSTPPVFFIHAADDNTVSVNLSLNAFAALKAAKVPAEMHIFEEGGHGFGVRQAAGKPVEAWPDLLVRWGVQHQFFTGVGAATAAP